MLAGLLAVGQQARAGVERITGLLEVAARDRRPARRPALVPPTGRMGLEVRFEHVSFAYGRPTRTPVLDDFDLTVRAGGDRRPGRRGGLGQVDRRPAGAPLLRPDRRRRAHRAASTCAT